MEAQAQWAGKLLQEYQRRVEASGFPGPQTEGTKDASAKTVQGACKEVNIESVQKVFSVLELTESIGKMF